MKEFDKLLRSYHKYLTSLLSQRSKSTEIMDKFLRSCGKNSYYCVREYYCKLRTKEEIWSDIYVSFIILVNRYKYQERHFTAYVHNVLGYEIGRVIHSSLRDMRDHKGLTADFNNINANLSRDEDMVDYNLDIIIGYEEEGELTDKWIIDRQEEECSLFAILNPEEKKFIKQYYMDEMPDRLIADKASAHINTVNKRRRDAVIKLEDKYGLDALRARRVERKTL